MKTLVVLGVILGLLFVGDRWVEGFAEERIAAELQSSFDDSGEAEVELSGFPITLRLITGSIPEIKITSSSLKRQGMTFKDVRMTLEDVTFSLSQIAAGEIRSVEVASGEGRVSLPPNDLARAFGEAGFDIQLDEDGLSVQIGPVEATAQLELEGTQLVLRASRLDRNFTVDLPRFVEGLQYRSVRVEGGKAVLEFSLKDSSFSKL